MTDIRMIVSWGVGAKLNKDWFSNTIYFANDQPGPDYQALTDEVRDAYAACPLTAGCKIEVRTYNMGDAKPRPEKAYATVTKTGALPDGPHQVALCLSYYSERNLPRQRGRIYLGPFTNPAMRPSGFDQGYLRDLALALKDVGGLDVDWSVYSPTKAAAGEDPTMSITQAWVDNSWDIIRSRKQAGTTRLEIPINE